MKDLVKKLLGRAYMNSKVMAQAGRVTESEYTVLPGGIIRIRGTVGWGFTYTAAVEIDRFAERAKASCACRDAGVYGICVHAGALMCRYEDRINEAAGNDPAAETFLSIYRNVETPSESGSVHIVPVLTMENGFPRAAFKIGRDKLYMIKGLVSFTESMKYHETVDYGEKFRFTHDENALDERSRKLYRMIRSYAEALIALEESQPYEGLTYAGDRRELPLSPDSFDVIFDLFMGERIPSRDGGASWQMLINDPKVDVNITDGRDALRVTIDPPCTGYESNAYGYVISGRTICRVSEGYRQDMLPLILASAGTEEAGNALTFSPKGMSEFCMTVLPRISSHAGAIDTRPIEKYMPEDISVRYLIDMPERGTLTAQVNFTYGDRFVRYGASPEEYPDIRRNTLLEQQATNALTEYFDPPVDDRGIYTLTDEEKIYDLIKNGTDKLEKYGEVFISDRLKNLTSRRAPHPTMKAGVKGGMLELTLDTDEFPAEELDALMRSVREKRRYYRLEDGSFLNLEDGAFTAFTKAADSMGVSAKDLTSGALVPLYKALYLDDALKEDPSVRFIKDPDFRKLLRDFKTVEDSDFVVPEPLDTVLRPYQKTGYRWLRTLDAYGFGGILADDMGLGKTLQVLTYLLSLKRERRGGTSLILCPASVILSWTDEVQKWAPELKVCALTQSASERALMIAAANEFDIVISSYDSFRNDIESHVNMDYYACILDEAQYIKNRETKLNRCVRRVNARMKLALTGTPVENRLAELWNIFEFILPGYLGTYSKFREKYEQPITDADDKVARSTLSKLVSPFVLRRMKTDVLSELPPKTETNCYIQMGEAQRKLYIAYADKLKRMLEGGAGAADRMSILAMLTRLRQLCCDPAMFVENYEGGSCKVDECLRMIDELTQSGHRILLFSQFTTMLGKLRGLIEESGITCFTLQGDTPLSERGELVNAFNAGKAQVFLISLKAGGTGLNLTGADTVIHFDPWWNLSAQNQATDRCYRIGQDRAVQVYKLIAADSIEENIVKLQHKKLSLSKVVTDSADGGIMDLSPEELLELLK